MYSDRFSLPFVSSVVIDAAERLRPGLGPWSDATSEALRQVFLRELAEIKPRFMELFNDEGYWSRLEAAVMTECFPRYCEVAKRQSTAEAKDYYVWRGGDLLARGAFALGGMIVGVGLVYLPFIPIPETWRFLILLTMLGGPFLPEAQIALFQRRFRKDHQRIVQDMHRAQEVDRLYEPMPTADSPPPLAEPEQAAHSMPTHAAKER